MKVAIKRNTYSNAGNETGGIIINPNTSYEKKTAK